MNVAHMKGSHMLLRHAIGAALRRVRLQRGLTLRQLSERARVSVPYLSEVERGRKEASSEILSTICVVLGLSVPELLRETDAEFAGVRPPVLEIRTRSSERSEHVRTAHTHAVREFDGVDGTAGTGHQAQLLAA